MCSRILRNNAFYICRKILLTIQELTHMNCVVCVYILVVWKIVTDFIIQHFSYVTI